MEKNKYTPEDIQFNDDRLEYDRFWNERRIENTQRNMQIFTGIKDGVAYINGVPNGICQKE